jgi:hypothetical protein
MRRPGRLKDSVAGAASAAVLGNCLETHAGCVAGVSGADAKRGDEAMQWSASSVLLACG